MVLSKEEAQKAFDKFLCFLGAKCPNTCEILAKDRETEMNFSPSMISPPCIWKHLRTTNPIESAFATVRLMTGKTRNGYTATTVLSMGFQLCRSAQRRWRRLDGTATLAEVIKGVKFVNGIKEEDAPFQLDVLNI